jgi:hypothetical protein
MLDESECERISKTYGECISAVKEARAASGCPLKEIGIDARFQPVRDLYEEMTGWREMHHNAIMHHRLSIYGPPCVTCGKPLRTPRATFCAACGTRVHRGE